MAVANGTIAYCLSWVPSDNPLPTMQYFPVDVGSEIRLIDSCDTQTTVITDYELITLGMRGNIKSRVDLELVTQHTPTQLVSVRNGCLFITSAKTLVEYLGGVATERSESYVSICPTDTDARLLTDVGDIHYAMIGSLRPIVAHVRITPDNDYGVLSLLVLSSAYIGWNEEIVLGVKIRDNETQVLYNPLPTTIVKCAAHHNNLYVLDGEGNVSLVDVNNSSGLEHKASGYINLCSRRIRIGSERISIWLLLGVQDNGQLVNLSQECELRGVPDYVTVTCSDMFIPNKRIKSAVN